MKLAQSRITQGDVRGVTDSDGVTAFYGIPYAPGPAGPARFALPGDPPSWDGERDCTSPGPTAPQPAGRLSAIGVDLTAILGAGWQQGTDYLTANVWTPDPGGSGLPVMVFIHGGAFVGGAATERAYDGTAFAKSGVVLVSVNYRLGFAGWGSVPGAPENRGLHDQLAALRWVQANIASFGGDPSNVTVFGESAGALSVGALLAVAEPGLFRRAVVQSGGASHSLTPSQAALVTELVTARVGDPVLASDADLVGAVASLLPPPDLRLDGVADPTMGLAPVSTVLDPLLPSQAVDLIAAGAGADVDLLVGHCTDEMNLYYVLMPLPAPSEEQVHAAVSRLHPDPSGVLDAYRAAGRGSAPVELLGAVGTDFMFAVPSARLATAHTGRTHRYEFTWRSPAVDGRLGACHGLELPFVFNGIGRIDYGAWQLPVSDETLDLSRRTHEAWVSFATTGDPGWPAYSTDTPTTQLIGPDWRTTDTPDGPQRSVWDGVR